MAVTKLGKAEIMEYAVAWETLQVKRDHLNELFEGTELNTEQMDYIGDYVNYLTENIQSLEGEILDIDADGLFYCKVRDAARTLNIKPSQKFMNDIADTISSMQMNILVIGKPFQLFNKEGVNFTYIEGSEIANYNFKDNTFSEYWIISYELNGREKYNLKNNSTFSGFTAKTMNNFLDVKTNL